MEGRSVELKKPLLARKPGEVHLKRMPIDCTGLVNMKTASLAGEKRCYLYNSDCYYYFEKQDGSVM